MFGILKNISTFTKREINGLAIVLNLLYFALMVVIPTIIVCSQYNLFYKAETMTKLTGVGIIVVVILGIYLLTKCKDAINNLPEITYKQQCLKFTIQLALAGFVFFVIFWAFIMAKDNIDLAYKVFVRCLISIAFGYVVDLGFLKYVNAELKIRQAALFDKEKDKRKGLI